MDRDKAPANIGNTDKASVFWMTNMAAPYRIPVWTDLSQRFLLTVGLLESNASLIGDESANRGPDWLHSLQKGINFVEIPTIKIRRGEARYYVPRDLNLISKVRNSDIVLFGGWESPAYWFALIVSAVCGTGRVAFYESPINTMRHRRGPAAWLRSMFFRSMHMVVTPGRAASDSIVAMGVSPGRITEGFNAVNVQAFHAASQAVCELELNEAPGHHYLYVGQLIARKRVDRIVDAFQEIASSRDQLTIIGAGDRENALTDQVSRIGQRISILPVVENRELPRIMAQHHTLVLASSTEVWGLVVNEALASGMHAVVSSNCGVAASVAHMDGIFLAAPDLSDLAMMMKESRENWDGRIHDPQILEHTPTEFAERFCEAFAKALSARYRASKASRLTA